MANMSPKAAFYILAESSTKARDLYACRLIEKAYINGQEVYAHTSTIEEAQDFDTQLWTFRDISFVPHEVYNQNSSSELPVVIGYNGIIPMQKAMLVNLTAKAPSFYQQFDHIIEIIPNDDELKSAARTRYQFYQQQGHQMETFKITTTNSSRKR
jgi:DNA polymerase III subunit chi